MQLVMLLPDLRSRSTWSRGSLVVRPGLGLKIPWIVVLSRPMGTLDVLRGLLFVPVLSRPLLVGLGVVEVVHGPDLLV